MLAILAAVILGLLLAAAAGPIHPAVRGWALGGGAAIALLAALAALMLGSRAGLALPLGLPGSPLTLALDPVSAFFLLPVCIASAAAASCGAGCPALAPVLAAAMLLTLLAGDGVTLVLGYGLLGAAGWGLTRSGAHALLATAAPLALLVAFGVAAPAPGFDALRAAPPEGWRAALVLALALLAAGPALLAAQRPPPQEGGAASVLLAAAAAWTAVYLLARMLLDVCGPATPAWWGAAPVALGAAAMLAGGVAANRALTLTGVLAALGLQGSGAATLGLGLALYARGFDMPGLAAAAVGGALLQALGHAAALATALLCAHAAERAAGTGLLDRLGGLARAMPGTAACLLAAAASLAGLPLTAGFASVWLLLQAALAAARFGGLAAQTGLAIAAAAVAMGTALAAAAMLRLAGLAFLSRPRSPRVAAAEDPPARHLALLGGLAGLLTVVGLLPGAALALAAGARRALSASAVPVASGWLGLAEAADMPGYQPLALALLGGLVAAGLWAITRRLLRPVPAAPWDGGFAPAPPWLPFGDPAAQPDAALLAAPVLDALGGAPGWLQGAASWRDRVRFWLTRAPAPPRPRLALAALLALAVAALAGMAWLKAA